MRKTALRLFAVGASIALLAACGSNNDGGGGNTPADTATDKPAETKTEEAPPPAAEPVTLTIWHNNTVGDNGYAFWAKVKADYEAANEGVTLDTVGVTNEDLDGKLQTAMNAGTPPDIFLQRGGGKLKDMVDAGFVADITALINAPGIPEGAFASNSVGGKAYAMPMDILPGGMFYSKDLFAQAGITSEPKNFTEMNDAVAKLKAAGITPIAVGGKDGWPAAHWFYWFALRVCPQDVLESAGANADLSDPCFLAAGEQLKAFSETNPFNEGFLTTSAQQGAGSSAGMVANHQAAMELMGAWNIGVIGSLTPDGERLPDLGFFPFPAVEGGKGDPSAMMGGVDAFSCSSKAPQPACGNFLNYLGSTEVQTAFMEVTGSPPANSEAAAAVTDPVLKIVSDHLNNAAYVSLWLDTRLGQNIGNALNGGVVEMMAGNGTPQGIIDAANDAAKKG